MAVNDGTSNSVSEGVKKRRGLLPPEVLDALTPSLKVGALTGSAGLLTGVTAGILRDVSPVLFGAVAGVQWFALGSTFWLSRTACLHSLKGDKELTSWDKTQASAVAGGAAGMVGGLLRGPRNILPGIVFFSLVGGGGQAATDYFSGASCPTGAEKGSILRSKWSPLRQLSDDEYREMMREKMLKIDVEIALVDDKIAELRSRGSSNESSQGKGLPDGGKPET